MKLQMFPFKSSMTIRPYFISVKQVSVSSHLSSICQTGCRDEQWAELLSFHWRKCPWTRNWISASSTGAALSLHSTQKAIAAGAITSPSNRRIYTLWRRCETQAVAQLHKRKMETLLTAANRWSSRRPIFERKEVLNVQKTEFNWSTEAAVWRLHCIISCQFEVKVFYCTPTAQSVHNKDY